MSDKEKQDLQQEITKLETQISTMQDSLDSMKETLQNLKDIAWDRQSKRESSSMYKVLNGEKDYTKVQSKVGEIQVDKDFMEKQTRKHLDNPNLRGMVTSEEMLSFPKVAKSLKPEYNDEYQGYTWKTLSNDDKIIAYGIRKYKINNEQAHRLLTTHSKTERGQRKQRQADRVSSAIYFNNPDSRGSALQETSISQNPTKSQVISKQDKIKALQDEARNISKNTKTKDKELEL